MEKTGIGEYEDTARTHYDNLTRVADYYRAKKQTVKAIEEIGELLAELGRRMNGADNRDALAEEIADTYNMLDQLCYLHGIEEQVQDIAEQKMERTAGKLVGEQEIDLSRGEFEEICEQVHNRWWAEQIDRGEYEHPDMQPYSALSETTRERVRATVRRGLDALGMTYDA